MTLFVSLRTHFTCLSDPSLRHLLALLFGWTTKHVESFVYAGPSHVNLLSHPWLLSTSSAPHPRYYCLPYKWRAADNKSGARSIIFRTRCIQPYYVECARSAYAISYPVQCPGCEWSCTCRSVNTALEFLLRIFH
jgi:hypothetical protein